MKEIVIISGKGGTGKTSLVASFAALAQNAVLADCDVDAADLHLILTPRVQQTHPFSGGKQATIIAEKCTGCGKCSELCRFEAISQIPATGTTRQAVYHIDPVACEGCGVCAWFCPDKAIDFSDAINGHCYLSDTRYGPMVHAGLGIAQENSGKLVTLVRKKAREIAERDGKEFILVDGSPGIGCPVIASITGADLVLIVTEPTLSGEHDLKRVAQLVTYFKIPALVCINKYDLNPVISDRIIRDAQQRGSAIAGKVRYDTVFSTAQSLMQPVVEIDGSKTAEEVTDIWCTLLDICTSRA
ncbi:MAG: 4Fe-4S dicluster domain-containing protein [Chitinivibrionales bacterium]|nr:4Fe-4S dicluster domain-containing protein [Chitinivibrionales bacterium]